MDRLSQNTIKYKKENYYSFISYIIAIYLSLYAVISVIRYMLPIIAIKNQKG